MLYHCDYHDDEMPYPLKVGDKVLIEFPHQYTINDHRMLEHVTRQEFFGKSGVGVRLTPSRHTILG